MVDGGGIGVGMGMHIAEVKIDYDNWCLASRWLGEGGGRCLNKATLMEMLHFLVVSRCCFNKRE